MATKFVNTTINNRRDGVELLLSTLQGLRQEEIAAGDQLVRYKALESQLAGKRLDHVRDMTTLAQQRIEFASNHAYRMEKLKFDTEYLNHKRNELSEAALTRKANLLQTYASMNTRLNELVSVESQRKNEIKDKQIALVNTLEDSQAITEQYIFGERLDKSTGKPDGSGIITIRDPRIRQLYDSMFGKNQSLMSPAEFGRQWVEAFNTGLEDSRDQGEDSAFRYATEYATVRTVAQGITRLAQKGGVHPDLQRAADIWASGADTNGKAYDFIKNSIGFDNGGIVFNAKLDNNKLVGNGTLLISNNQRLSAPIREYARTYRESKTLDDSLQKMFNHSEQRVAELQVRTELMGHQLTKGFVDLFGEDYLKDNPVFSGASEGEGDTGVADDTGNGTGSPSGQEGAQTSPSAASGQGQGFVPSGLPFAPEAAPEDALASRPPGFSRDEFEVISNVGFNLGMSENGTPIAHIKPYTKFGNNGQTTEVAEEQRPITLEDFSFGIPSSAMGGPMAGGARIPTSSQYDLAGYKRVKEAAARAQRIRDLDKMDELFRSEEFNKLWNQGPWAHNPDDGEEPIPPFMQQNEAGFANTGIQPGEGFYGSLRGEILKQATEMEFDNPELIAELGALQSTLETGHGRHLSGTHNYFGIKAGADQDSTTARTREGVNGKSEYQEAKFRNFNTPTESAVAYLKLITTDPRYAEVLKAKNIDEAIDIIGNSAYNTDRVEDDDPLTYAEKLRRIHKSKNVSMNYRP